MYVSLRSLLEPNTIRVLSRQLPPKGVEMGRTGQQKRSLAYASTYVWERFLLLSYVENFSSERTPTPAVGLPVRIGFSGPTQHHLTRMCPHSNTSLTSISTMQFFSSTTLKIKPENIRISGPIFQHQRIMSYLSGYLFEGEKSHREDHYYLFIYFVEYLLYSRRRPTARNQTTRHRYVKNNMTNQKKIQKIDQVPMPRPPILR